MIFFSQATWAEALIFCMGLFLILVGIFLIVQSWHNRTFRRIPWQHVDSAYQTGRFYTPPAIRDGRGLR